MGAYVTLHWLIGLLNMGIIGKEKQLQHITVGTPVRGLGRAQLKLKSMKFLEAEGKNG